MTAPQWTPATEQLVKDTIGQLVAEVFKQVLRGEPVDSDAIDTDVAVGTLTALAQSGALVPPDEHKHHLIKFDDDGLWIIQHPLSCRPNLFTCKVNHIAMYGGFVTPAQPGVYLCWPDMDHLVIAEIVPEP